MPALGTFQARGPQPPLSAFIFNFAEGSRGKKDRKKEGADEQFKLFLSKLIPQIHVGELGSFYGAEEIPPLLSLTHPPSIFSFAPSANFSSLLLLPLSCP